MPVTSSNLAGDVGKYVQDRLIARSNQLHRLPQFTNKVSLPSGMAKTANFVKYNRTDVPVDTLSEGVTPAETPFTISTQTIEVDQWGLWIGLTDVGLVTTKHPVLNEAIKLVADAIARTQDYNLAEILNRGSNVQYADGVADRPTLANTDKISSAVLVRARADLNNDGAPPREGDMFVAVMGPGPEADLLVATGSGSFVAAAEQQKMAALEKGYVGQWQGFKIVRSNFLPKFQRFTHGFTIAVGTGGSLATSTDHFLKFTRKSLTRGFEEDISVQVTQATGGSDTRITLTAPATAGYAYNVYVGTTTGDATLYRVKENADPGEVFYIDTVPTSGTTPPATPASGVIVHPVYVFAEDAVDWVELNELSMKGIITPFKESDSDPLNQRRKVGAKYMGKSGIRDSDRMKRIEVHSAF
jgi:N4-gp56 family major capsid protein